MVGAVGFLRKGGVASTAHGKRFGFGKPLNQSSRRLICGRCFIDIGRFGLEGDTEGMKELLPARACRSEYDFGGFHRGSTGVTSGLGLRRVRCKEKQESLPLGLVARSIRIAAYGKVSNLALLRLEWETMPPILRGGLVVRKIPVCRAFPGRSEELEKGELDYVCGFGREIVRSQLVMLRRKSFRLQGSVGSVQCGEWRAGEQ